MEEGFSGSKAAKPGRRRRVRKRKLRAIAAEVLNFRTGVKRKSLAEISPRHTNRQKAKFGVGKTSGFFLANGAFLLKPCIRNDGRGRCNEQSGSGARG